MKYPKLLSAALAAAISVSTIVPAGAFAVLSGDVDGSGTVTADDLSLLQDYVLGKSSLTKEQSENSDVNGDKKIDSHDVAELRRLILSTAKNLSFKSVTERLSEGYTDTLRKLDIQKGESAVRSAAELKTALSPYFSESVVNSYLKKYDDNFFKDSVLLIKPVYFDPAKYQKTAAKETLSCGCSTDYAGIYTTADSVDIGLNIRRDHSFTSDSLGIIPAGTKMTIKYGTSQFAHVTYNGISGYVNMAYMKKLSGSAVEYNAIPDIKIEAVKYSDGKVTVNAGEFHSTAPIGFAAAIIAQAVIPQKEYYASEAKWNVSTIAAPTTTTTTTTTSTYPLAQERLDKLSSSLSKDEKLNEAFKIASAITYYGHTADMPQDDKTTMEWYADYGFKNGKGNCYVMAAMFCEMAKLLGYDAHLISGKVPLLAGGYGPHSWVEVVIDGTVYVCDPDFTNETKKNGYMITYGQSGTWMYKKESVMS